jgi:hypothetical protein
MTPGLLLIAFTALLLTAAPALPQNSASGAENLKYSRDFYAKVHFVALAGFSFGASEETKFKYDRYPNGGPERMQSGDGQFARKSGKIWLQSDDWGETGTPADATTSRRLNNWVELVNGRFNAAAPLEFVSHRDQGEREEEVFQEAKAGKEQSPRYVFGKYKNDQTTHPLLLSEFSGPMKLGPHSAMVKITFSHLVSVTIKDATDAAATPTPATNNAAAEEPGRVTLLDGKLQLNLTDDFSRDPADPKEPKTLARFSGPDGAWGEVLRGTHGLTPDKLDGYLKMRVQEYSKGFSWLPKDSKLHWLKHEIVTLDGHKWADWRYVPMLKGRTDYQRNPVYTRFLTTSYKDQLLEITFTSNLNTEPKVKEEIDQMMDSIHLED